MNPWLYMLPLALWVLGACIVIVWCAMCARMPDESEWTPEPMRPIVNGQERDPYTVLPDPRVVATGAALDALAEVCGLTRRPGKRTWRTLWLVSRDHETDTELRERVRARVLGVRDGVL